MQRSLSRWAYAILAMGLAACASGPVYQAPDVSDHIRLADVSLGDGRYRVTYMGEQGMSADAVREHAMLEAAKLTLDERADWLEVLQGATPVVAKEEAGPIYVHTLEFETGRGQPAPAGPAVFEARALYSDLKAKLRED